MPAFRGCYVFGDFVSGRVWALNTAVPSQVVELPFNLPFLRTFGEDSAGELYVTSGGEVLKIVPSAASAVTTTKPRTVLLAPNHFCETGAFSPLSRLNLMKKV